MPVRNQQEWLSLAVASVLSNSASLLELIIIDGASDDGTKELIERLASHDSRVRWLSEPDAGPADAVNKALRIARGTIIGWLNADDVYVVGAIERALSALSCPGGPVMVYGEGEYIDENGSKLRPYPSLLPNVPVHSFLNGCFVCQPTVFFKRTVPLLVGDLDSSLRTAFDFDYWLRIFKAFPNRIGFVSELQAQSRWHQAAISARMRRDVSLEGLRVLHRHFGLAPAHWALTHLEEAKVSQALDLNGYLVNFLLDARPFLSDVEYALVVQGVATALRT